jgi:hypothetical protein
LDRIAKLETQARQSRPDTELVQSLIGDIRVYFAAVGATYCPPATNPGVSAGSRDQAEKVYRRGT